MEVGAPCPSSGSAHEITMYCLIKFSKTSAYDSYTGRTHKHVTGTRVIRVRKENKNSENRMCRLAKQKSNKVINHKT